MTTQLDQVDWDWKDTGKVIKSWEAHGLNCLVLVGPMGTLNGYVKVPESHPWHGTAYSGCVDKRQHHDGWEDHITPESICDVHGGLTFSGKMANHEGHWFGFDTSHHGDFTPGMYFISPQIPVLTTEGAVRNSDYVHQETESLAHQISEWKPS